MEVDFISPEGQIKTVNRRQTRASNFKPALPISNDLNVANKKLI
jgi:hypothetical protein